MSWNFIDSYSGPSDFQGYDLDDLDIDQFYLNVTTNADDYDKTFLYSLDNDCVGCPYLFRDKNQVNIFKTNTKFRITNKHIHNYSPSGNKSNVICDIDENFGQFGVYELIVENKTTCTVVNLKSPVNIYSPILTVVLIYLVVYGVVYGSFLIYNKWIRKNGENAQNGDPENKNVQKKERVMSLDTFRGISIVIMIFVNFGGGGYRVFEHAVWNGLHLADLVFPWFMWIMGACIPISLSSSFKKKVANKDVLYNVAKRSLKLFLLGIFLNGGSGLNYIRIMGVLQRFGIAYFVVTITCLYFVKRETNYQNSKLKWIEDILQMMYCWIIALTILIVHTILIFQLTDSDCPKGYFGPSGLSRYEEDGEDSKCYPGGATGLVDSKILGNHQYQHPTIYEIYEIRPFDPEGILGTFTTIFQVFLGVQAGVILLTYKNHWERLLRWCIWSLVTGIIAGALCGFSKEDGVIPVNKNLWSLSFVMVTSCFAFALLSFCYLIIDVQKWWNGKPFLFAGMNAILMYIGHEMTDGHFPVRWYYGDDDEGNWRNTHFISLLSDSWGSIFWVLVSYYLYKIKYFFTV